MAEPLKVVGVDADRVGSPRGDGTRGSALYVVPIRLSRSPSPREAELLVRHWDHPGSWSTSHRPGIARVEGDLFVLDGTTIEEVRDVHAGMLRQVLAATNADEARLAEREEQQRTRALKEDLAHKQNVRDVARDIRF